VREDENAGGGDVSVRGDTLSYRKGLFISTVKALCLLRRYSVDSIQRRYWPTATAQMALRLPDYVVSHHQYRLSFWSDGHAVSQCSHNKALRIQDSDDFFKFFSFTNTYIGYKNF